MPATTPCVPSCSSTPIITNVPGQQGNNAYTTTTATFVVPAVGSSATVQVVNSGIAGVGQVLFIQTAGYYTVTSIPSSNILVCVNGILNPNTSLYAAALGNAALNTIIAAGVSVTPAGPSQISLNPISPTTSKGDLIVDNGGGGGAASDVRIAVGTNGQALVADSTQASGIKWGAVGFAGGGTSGTSKATAQSGLGLGQNAVISNAPMSQAITASSTQAGAVSSVAAAAGSYLLMAKVAIAWSGVTFASSRTITLVLRNNTQGVNYLSTGIATQVLTTTNLPTSHYLLPLTVQTLAANDAIQIYVLIDVVNSAGTLSIVYAEVTAIPLALS